MSDVSRDVFTKERTICLIDLATLKCPGSVFFLFILNVTEPANIKDTIYVRMSDAVPKPQDNPGFN